jgi:starch synthase
MSRILMISSEAAPLAKTGGLADVVGALPRALAGFGHETAVVLPRYAKIDLKRARRVWDHLPVWLGANQFDTSVWLADLPTPFYLIDCPALFDRPGFYGEDGADYPDNHIRFAVFSKAALAVARHIFRSDILHCHDWQAGLVPVYLNSTYALDPTFFAAKTVFTIHNLGYQGLFPRACLPAAGLDEAVYRPDGVEFFGQISYLKGGISFADALTTVSPTYAREIQTPELGFGLDGTLRSRAGVLTGILNGVDYEEWSPGTDAFIPASYSAGDLSGKAVCKRDLLREFGLPEAAMDRPLVGMVSRFTPQKGIGLVAEVAGQMAADGMYLVALGSGAPEFEDRFRRIAEEHPDRIAVRFGFHNALAHRIEAGADMFLMPSEYEPCGLNQIYSLRYGTVPVVRATGGLDDTIEEGTGFKFWDYTGSALAGALRAANEAFADRGRWHKMMVLGMAQDFSWKSSAGAYSALYRRLLQR